MANFPAVKSQRAFWLTPHLLGDAAGAAADAAVHALPGRAREAILEACDRLAAISVLVAQQLYRHAAVAWTHFGAGGFSQWVELGERIATSEVATREGALAFFAVAPQGFGPGGLTAAAAWRDLAERVARSSRKLSAVFLKTTAPLLVRDDGLERLREWVEVGVRLHSEHGWQGEFLAQGFFSAAPRAVLVFEPRLYQLWAGACAALYAQARDREVFEQLPAGIQRWKAADHEALLKATLGLAALSAKPAHRFYRELPRSLHGLAPELRTALLRLLVPAVKRSVGTIGDFIPVAGALVRQVAAEHRATALGEVARLAQRCPDVVLPALRSLPRVYEDASPEQAAEWFRAGLEIAEENTQAGIAYFALESRTSLKVLYAAATAVTLEEAQGLLRKYVQMLSGEPVSISSSDRFRLLLPIEEFPAENEVAMPLRIDLLATHEDNLRLYRFLAAQLAGRREFGTYEFSSGDSADGPPGNALWRYLNQPEHPPLLEELFLLAEGFRVYRRLCAEYRGLAGEGEWAGRQMIRVWQKAPGSDRGLDGLFAFLLAGLPLAECPQWLEPQIAVLLVRFLAPLAAPGAGVADAMRIAEELARLLAEPGRAHGLRDDEGPVVFEQLAAEAMFDPYSYEDDGLPAPARAAGEQPAQPRETPGAEEQKLALELAEQPDESGGAAMPISPEELRRLLEMGVKLDIKQARGQDVDGLGLYITDLLGKVPSEQIEELRKLLGEADGGKGKAARRWSEPSAHGAVFYYDEWDYHIGDYRSRWCRLQEIQLEGDSGEFFQQALTDYAALIPEVRRQFQRIRPETYRVVRGLEDGEDFDLNAAINARIELRARQAPSGKLYVARQREERDVATLFLIDMSASTDEPMNKEEARPAPFAADDWLTDPRALQRARRRAGRRIIDVTKEALVIMAAALDEIGDAYAVYGFSGHGRNNVELYRVKSFAEPLSSGVKGRIGDIQPKRSTRMGAALRHAIEKMSTVTARSKHLFLLSDGFPQDHDYGQDRRSNVYGIRDTAVALREVETAGITPFCITVDKAGHDYLREMCDESRYMVIDDIAVLPRELPKIYQRIVR